MGAKAVRAIVGSHSAPPRRIARTVESSRSAWDLALTVSAALALIGWTDVALIFYPMAWGNHEWEFASITVFFDALPLGTIGLATLAIVGVHVRSKRVLLPLLALFPLVTLILIAGLVMYLLTATIAWTHSDPVLQTSLQRAVIKTSILAVLYTGLYGWLSRTVVRTFRRI